LRQYPACLPFLDARRGIKLRNNQLSTYVRLAAAGETILVATSGDRPRRFGAPNQSCWPRTGGARIQT
jgi:hypothetical protein